MPHRFDLISMPASREPATLLAVERAVSEIRRGRFVAIKGAGGTAALVLAAEGATQERLENMKEASQSEASLVITARRAAVLGLIQASLNPIRLTLEEALTDQIIGDLADPLTNIPTTELKIKAEEVAKFSCESAGIGLAKVARLLPSAVVAPLEHPESEDLAPGRHGMTSCWSMPGMFFNTSKPRREDSKLSARPRSPCWMRTKRA